MTKRADAIHNFHNHVKELGYTGEEPTLLVIGFAAGFDYVVGGLSSNDLLAYSEYCAAENKTKVKPSVAKARYNERRAVRAGWRYLNLKNKEN